MKSTKRRAIGLGTADNDTPVGTIPALLTKAQKDAFTKGDWRRACDITDVTIDMLKGAALATGIKNIRNKY
jgi:hypothetical protein